MTFVASPAAGTINGNEAASDHFDQVKTYTGGRKEQMDTAHAKDITDVVNAIANGAHTPTPPSTVAKDLEQAIKDYDNASADVQEKVGETAKETITNGKILLPLMDILNAKPNNNAQLNLWLNAWNKLNDDPKKALAEQIRKNPGTADLETRAGDYALYKKEIDALTRDLNPITKLTAENKGTVERLILAYNAMESKRDSLETDPVVTEQDLLPLNVATKLEDLKKTLAKIAGAESAITEISSDVSASPAEFEKEYLEAKEAFDALSKDEQALVPSADKLTEAETKYDDYLKELGEDKQKANEVIREIEKLSYGSDDTAGSTAEDIIKVQKMYDESLSPTQKEIVNAHSTAKTKLDDFKNTLDSVYGGATKLIDKIIAANPSTLTRENLEKILLDVANSTDNEKKIIRNTVSEKLEQLKDLSVRLANAEAEIGDIPTGSTNPEDCELCSPDSQGGTSHDTTFHIESIENAKIEYEKLTESEKRLLSSEIRSKIESEYVKLKAHLEEQVQRLFVKEKAENIDVSVHGLITKVDSSNVPSIETAAEVTIYVDAKKTDKVLSDLPNTMKNVASFDVKLMAKADDGIAIEIQPKKTKSVLVKLPVGENIDTLTAKVYHIKSSGIRTIVENVSFIRENNNMYAVFGIESFSEFIVVDKKIVPVTPPSGGSSGGGGTQITITAESTFWAQAENEIKFKSTNPVEVTGNYENIPVKILQALKETDKTLTLNLGNDTITLTSNDLAGISLAKDSYTIQDLRKMLTPTVPSPTPKPTPVPEPEPTPALNLTWLWVLLTVLAIGAGVIVFLILKKKSKEKEEGNTEKEENKGEQKDKTEEKTEGEKED